MRIVRNLDYVKKRKRMARLEAAAGFLVLAALLALSSFGGIDRQPYLFGYVPIYLLFYVLLVVGMILFHTGIQQLAKWGRNPRNDQLIDNQVRGLGEKYVLIHYSPVGKRTIEHMLIHPGGVLTLTARDLPGKVSYDGRWRRLSTGFSRLFGMGGPQLGNPSADADADVAALRRYLAAAQLEVDVDAAIVFLNPRVELDVAEPDYPVMNAEGLSGFVRGLPVDASLTATDRQALTALLAKGEEVEQRQPVARRRPVKRRAA
jgi:hypothetical protein